MTATFSRVVLSFQRYLQLVMHGYQIYILEEEICDQCCFCFSVMRSERVIAALFVLSEQSEALGLWRGFEFSVPSPP